LELKIGIYVAVTATSPDEVTRLLTKYVRITRQILKTMPLSQYSAGVSPNYIFGMVPSLSWDYGPVGRKTNADGTPAGPWLKSAKFTLTLKYSER